MKKWSRARVTSRALPLAIVFLVACAGTLYVIASDAATHVIPIEAESATLSGATQVTDATASGGTAVKFEQPTVASRCPAYPAFPNAACTGVIPGTTLRACSGTITLPNVTLQNCLFSTGISISQNAKNVTISNSKIIGPISAAVYPLPNDLNLKLIDVEADGNDSELDFWANGNLSCVRCNVHDFTKGFIYGNYSLVDTFIHDIYGTRDVHSEAVLIGGGNVSIVHSNLDANWSPTSNGGGMSAALAMYTHGTFWGSLNNVLVEKSRLTTSQAYYCLYGGNSSDPTDGDPSNIRIVDTVFDTCSYNGSNVGPVTGWLRGNGNVWQNNRWSNGMIITEPQSNNYN